ncbi:protein CASC1 isoform X2 [Thalassophryne amazonica]|uniref:protein CASC1 isoform X2 n=1 Tax=Thalassophryne amazonica TaxID=390379 RepID=UPI001470D8B7|nr:protein CASC1 isoform X2 [Thalassophryne amazonica]
MCCDGAPDPADQRDINTYITNWKDDPEVNIAHVLRQCNFTLQLIEELEGLRKDATDPKAIQIYQEGFIRLHELIHSKLLLASEEILKDASVNTDIETGNMQTVIRDENMALCLWANIKKNPRFEGLTFEEVGLGFEVSRRLAVSDIAIRFLHTCYDHLTFLALITHYRMHTPSHRFLTGPEKTPADLDMLEATKVEEVKEKSTMEPQQREEEEVQSIQKLQDKMVKQRPTSVQSRTSSVQFADGRVDEIQTQMEVLSAVGELTSASEQSAEGDMGQSGQVEVVDLKQHSSLGGVFYFDVFHLPPQTRYVKGWKITQLSDEGLQVFPYPMRSQGYSSVSMDVDDPVGVSVTVPDSVVLLKPPKVARWEAAEKQWRMDGIKELTYEEAEAKVTFKMDSFYTFTLIQETYANFPFRSWELRPLGQDSALFTVRGALIELSIAIQGSQCMLQSEHEKRLSHLTGKWMSGAAMQRAIVHAGINIFVNEHTDKYISTCGKDPLTEHAAYEQMALLASACAFSGSQWNAKCGAEHLVMQMCEHHGPAPVSEGSWRLYLLGAQKIRKLKVTEDSECFSPEHYPGSEFHSTLFHMMQDDMSPDGIVNITKSSYQFVDAVQNLLCATRPLAYSYPCNIRH